MSEVEGCFGSWAGGWVRFTDHDGRFGSARLGSLGWVGYTAFGLKVVIECFGIWGYVCWIDVDIFGIHAVNWI